MPGGYLDFLDRMAAEYGVPREEARAIYELETRSGRNVRRSSAGAQGHMQLMPGTARDMGVTDINDPYQNIRGGVRYYSQQRKAFGDPALAAAAYNAGPGRVQRVGGVPRIRETQDYVSRFRGMLGSQPPVTERAPTAMVPAPQEPQAMTEMDMIAGVPPVAQGPSTAEQLRALTENYSAVADRQASENARRFAEAQALVGKMYGGPSTADTLFALGRALLSPRPYGGFGGTMYNVSEALNGISDASQTSAQKRAEALARLKASYEEGVDKSELTSLEGRRKLLEMQLEQEKAAAEAAKAKYDIDPTTGAYKVRPGTGGNLGVLTPEQVAAAMRDPNNRGRTFYTTDGREGTI